jgi:alpha-L-fucosidase
MVVMGLIGGTASAAEIPYPVIPPVPQGPYQTTWDSLTKHPVPDWFKDAKFGIYTHWSAYSVPEFGNEWYPRNMYIEGSAEFKHHQATYGDQSKFGYKDFIPMFKAEKFNAEEWADLFAKAGAKFAGPVAEHHDGFSMWAGKVNRWNAKDMGPKRDVVGELAKALRKRDIKLITSFHHGFNIQGYYTAKEGWDTGDPEYADLYGQFKDKKLAYDRWLAKIIEVIDDYRPDQIWFDFCLGPIPDEYKQKMAAYYYNRAAEWGKEVIITRKGADLPVGVGALDIERGRMDHLADFLWQTDDSVARNSWGYVKNLDVKPPAELVHELIDIVSKNGVLLLNVAPKSDGTISDVQKELLLEMGRWLDVNGEGIYGTRPWKIFGESPNPNAPASAQDVSTQEIRFTCKGEDLYAICLAWPEKKLLINSVRVNGDKPSGKITLLGFDKPLPFNVNEQKQLIVEFPDLAPDKRPCKYAYTLKLTGFELSTATD